MYRIKLVITTTQSVEVYKKDVENVEDLEQEIDTISSKVINSINDDVFLLLNTNCSILGIDSKTIVSFKLTFKEVKEKTEEEEEEEEMGPFDAAVPTDARRKSLIKGKK